MSEPGEIAEVVATVTQLRDELDALVARGLRATESSRLNTLDNLRSEFERIGAPYLTARIGELVEGIRNDDLGAARALLRAQSSLRLFERVLTLEVAAEELAFDGGEKPES